MTKPIYEGDIMRAYKRKFNLKKVYTKSDKYKKFKQEFLKNK